MGAIAFIFYLGWNIHWISRGLIPPSILIGIFGIPAPTTGMTRSTLAFVHGDWVRAFLWNPFTLPFYFLLVWSAFEIFGKIIRKQKLLFSRTLVSIWIIILIGAWITKLAMPSQWW